MLKTKIMAAVIILTLAGCSSSWVGTSPTENYWLFSSDPTYQPKSYGPEISVLAEQLADGLKLAKAKETPLVVLPIQELAEQNVLSSFGLYLADQLKMELYRQGFRIFCPGPRVEGALLQQIAGPWLSSPDTSVSSAGVSSIVYGFYQIGEGNIYVNVKMIALENLEMISAGACELPKDKDLLRLIEQKKILARPESPASLDEKKENGRRPPSVFMVKGKYDF